MSEPRFEFPRELRFTCTRCGDCCRGWHVMLGPGEAERLEALPWEGREQDLVERKPSSRVSDAGSGRLALARDDDGACIFLGSENQCRIHEHFGEQAKPLMCRLFPFGFFPVHDRVAVDVSFACRAVSEGRGEPLRDRVPEWARLLGETEQEETKHRFSKKYEVSGELLWELEYHLVEFLSDRSLSLLDRVRAVSEFMRLATTSDPRTETARQLRQAMAKGIPQQIRERPAEGALDRTQRAVFFHYLFVSLNPTPFELLEMTGKRRQRELKLRVQAADGFKFPGARPWIDNRETSVTFREIASIPAGYLDSKAGAVLVERYLKAKIVGQRFMREGEGELPFLEAVPRLLLAYPMLLWTAKALAAEREANEVEEADSRRALRLLDRSYGEIRLSELPAKQRKAWSFVLLETELPLCAALEMLRAGSSA